MLFKVLLKIEQLIQEMKAPAATVQEIYDLLFPAVQVEALKLPNGGKFLDKFLELLPILFKLFGK